MEVSNILEIEFKVMFIMMLKNLELYHEETQKP